MKNVSKEQYAKNLVEQIIEQKLKNTVGLKMFNDMYNDTDYFMKIYSNLINEYILKKQGKNYES